MFGVQVLEHLQGGKIGPALPLWTPRPAKLLGRWPVFQGNDDGLPVAAGEAGYVKPAVLVVLDGQAGACPLLSPWPWQNPRAR